MKNFQCVSTGTPWENQVSYCRAVRAGDQIFVTGTVTVAENGGVFAPGDAYRQAKRCLQIRVEARNRALHWRTWCERACL